MKWAHRQAALVELELLVFTIGQVRLAAPLSSISGVLSDVSLLAQEGDLASIPFQGREIPLVKPANVFSAGLADSASPGAIILFRSGSGLYGMTVDSADQVIRIAPGDGFYRFPPVETGWTSTRGPWGVVELGDAPILLVDFGPVRAH
jgi:hypothetical protein